MVGLARHPVKSVRSGSARGSSALNLPHVDAQDWFFFRLLESAAQPFVAVDLDLRFVLVNPAFAALTGFSQEELAGMRVEDITPERWRAPGLKAAEQLRATGRSVRYEKEYLRKDGSLVPVEASGRPRTLARTPAPRRPSGRPRGRPSPRPGGFGRARRRTGGTPSIRPIPPRRPGPRRFPGHGRPGPDDGVVGRASAAHPSDHRGRRVAAKGGARGEWAWRGPAGGRSVVDPSFVPIPPRPTQGLCSSPHAPRVDRPSSIQDRRQSICLPSPSGRGAGGEGRRIATTGPNRIGQSRYPRVRPRPSPRPSPGGRGRQNRLPGHCSERVRR